MSLSVPGRAQVLRVKVPSQVFTVALLSNASRLQGGKYKAPQSKKYEEKLV